MPMKIVDGVMRMVPFTAAERAGLLAGTWTPGGPVVPTIKPGELKETKTRDRVGREISTFEGDKGVWMDQFKKPAMRQVRINNNPKPVYESGGNSIYAAKGGDIV